MRKTLFALGLVAVLSGCGGSDSKWSQVLGEDPAPVQQPSGDGTEISGDVFAPGGAVAQFRPESPFRLVLNFLVTPAAAAITGLEPVTGATVELVRIDNSGQQVGLVLAETTTSITGDYTLVVPAGVNLAGNLVVRITGQGGLEMRAQVVEQAVNITPVSEFVLRSFIDNGADLENLTTASVIKLSGQVDEFDLTAGADMSAMLAALEEEVGDFVDEAIELIASEPGNAALIAGDYRNLAFGWGLHDSDEHDVTSFNVDSWTTEMSFSEPGADAEAGEVSITFAGEESADARLQTNGQEPNAAYYLFFESEIDVFDESFPGVLSNKGLLTIESEFEENIEGDFGWRWPPALHSFQKTLNSDILVGVSNEISVRYETVDTDDDGEKDAVDPDKRSGTETFRGLEFFAKLPTAANTTDLEGLFGLVYVGTWLNQSGYMEVESEVAQATLDGAGLMAVSAADYSRVERYVNGTTAYVFHQGEAEVGIPYALNSDGTFDQIGGDSEFGFVNDDFDFFVLSNFQEEDDAQAGDNLYQEVGHGITAAVKLPQQPLSIDEKTYRLVGVHLEFNGTDIYATSLRLGSVLTITGPETASLDLALSESHLADKSAQLELANEKVEDLDVTVSLADNGAASFTVHVPDATFVLTGHLNHDGSLGIMQSQYIPNGGDPVSLGMAVLVEVEL